MDRRSLPQVVFVAFEGQVEEFELSPSYPGLWTRYILHTAVATVDNLPTASFYSVERTADRATS